MEIVRTDPSEMDLTNNASAKRMYYPQSYHHIQEIQKYNIQDYRPRYGMLLTLRLRLLTRLGWNNFKKLSAKSDKYNVCENNVDMLSHKQMSRKHVYCKPTIRRENVADMVRWQVRGQEVDNGCMNPWVFYCT